MRPETRTAFKAYVAQIAALNGIPADEVTSTKFAVAPSVEQKLEDVISHSHEFLELISIEPVINQTGQKVGISATRTMASRTNTAAGNRRTPTDPTDSAVKDTYFCRKTDFDSAIPYAKADAWRHRPERSEEHTSELQSLMRISYAVFSLK